MAVELPTKTPSPPPVQNVVVPETVPVAVFTPETVLTQVEQKNVDVIEMLIAEKSQISGELAQYKVLCKQRELEMEEFQVRFNLAVKRAEEMEQTFSQEQRVKDELRDLNERLTRESSQLKVQLSERSEYIEELKNCLVAEKQKLSDLENKKTDSVLQEIRAEDASDSRIEVLMQTKFMYEQQIRDLQAMVQQLSQDKEQSNQQYQNYASHLNQEIASLSEKNSELSEQVSSLEAREKSLIDHVSGLEKQIQQNLKHQQQQTENKEEENKKYLDEIKELKSQIDALNEEKMVFQLKIKSQEDKLEELGKSFILIFLNYY